MRVVVSAGGTGGHIYPALAIINKIKEEEPDSEFLYIGTTDRMEATIIPELGYDYIGLEIKGLNRQNPLKNINVLKSFLKAKKIAKKEIKKFNPDIVLGIGGYVTLPVLQAAHSLKIKTFIHEQNSIPGLSNKLLNKKVDAIGVSLPSSLNHFDKKKTTYTGNPRSEEVIKVEKVDKKKYGLTKNKKLVLFVMGSLGSNTVNNMMKEILPKFAKKDYEVLFVTGKNYFEEYQKMKNVPENVKLVPYLNDMLGVMKNTDLIISRAGASTISEITALGLPSILIPSPYVTHNHQEENAKVLENNGASIIIKEKELNDEILLEKIDLILNDTKRYNEMVKSNRKLGISDSATRIYKIIKKLVDNK
ncbi:MAG: undecaprenyldiphospho-muramoylpentapeptide beta-N-acetylglucosaminyltransferase [Bacilli bacterium]|nr:undecaprenyldiphospho-muramoylpentapeptide beta-N-acetylglucosaminyltransferase [Bacilli bacterium]